MENQDKIYEIEINSCGIGGSLGYRIVIIEF